MNIKQNRQRKPKEGDVLAIPLGDGSYGFGQICHSKSYAYFDLRSEVLPEIQDVVSCPVLFRVSMVQDAIKNGGWIILGNAPLKGGLAEPGTFWTQAVGCNDVNIFRNNVFIPAARDDVAGLELLAWWYEHHIVERLLDHFAGRPNKTAEFFRKVKSYDVQTGQEIKN